MPLISTSCPLHHCVSCLCPSPPPQSTPCPKSLVSELILLLLRLQLKRLREPVHWESPSPINARDHNIYLPLQDPLLSEEGLLGFSCPKWPTCAPRH